MFDKIQSPTLLSSGANGGSVGKNKSASASKRQKLLEKKLKTLEQVLIDSDGGLTNELSMTTSGSKTMTPTLLPTHSLFLIHGVMQRPRLLSNTPP